MQLMANVMTMPLGEYDASHISQWSILVASSKAPKCHHWADAHAILAQHMPWLSSSSNHKNRMAQLDFS
jgi:hypothetical protein